MPKKLTVEDINSLINDKVGKLTIVEYLGCYEVGKSGRKHWYRCECECGNKEYILTRNTFLSYLKQDNVVSCGCHKKENTSKINPRNEIKHKYLPFYQAWLNMKSRCNNSKNEFYHCYGGRGIVYDKKWEKFNGFYNDMFESWVEGLTIERKDVNGNYTKDNCCWIPMHEQFYNRRSNVIIEINGEKKFLIEWSQVSGIPIETIWSRLHNGIEGLDLIKSNPRNVLEKQSGVKGIRWSKKDKRWVIDKRIDGKKKRVKSFDEEDLDEAKRYFYEYIEVNKK